MLCAGTFIISSNSLRPLQVDGGRDLGLFLWRNFKQVCENANGLIGVCEDQGTWRSSCGGAVRGVWGVYTRPPACPPPPSAHAPTHTRTHTPSAGNADPQYSWGALMGFMSMLEAGVY